MSSRVRIRPAVREDLEAILRLHRQALLESTEAEETRQHQVDSATALSSHQTGDRIAEQCVLVAESSGDIVASNGLDLDRGEMLGLFVSQEFRGNGIGRRLVTEIERLAIQYGMWELETGAPQRHTGFFEAAGYKPAQPENLARDPGTRLLTLKMRRRFSHRQTHYGARIRRLLEEIGVSPAYGRQRRLKLQPECRQLATIGQDVHGREQMMQPEAAMAWYAMRNAAVADGVSLSVVSAFRSVGYQVSIFERKKQAGQTIEQILEVSAAPGYSEHHTGCAIDITASGSPPLEECFENTEAFEWLTGSADRFGFSLSYPRNNRHGIAYEPWHWAWKQC